LELLCNTEYAKFDYRIKRS